MHYVIARRSGEPGLESRFVSVLVPYRGDCPVKQVEEVAISPSDPMAACVKVTLADGRVDYVLSATGSDKRFIATDGSLRIDFLGQYGLVRTGGGKTESLHLMNGTELSCGDKSLTMPRDSLDAEIVSVDEKARTITIDATKDDLVSRVALIRTKGSPRRGAYTITAQKSAGGQTVLSLQSLDFVLARGVLETDPKANAIVSRIPVPFAYTIGEPTRYFDGAPIRNTRTGKIARVKCFTDMKNLEIDDPSGWKAGDGFEILDFVPGDKVTIPLSGQSE